MKKIIFLIVFFLSSLTNATAEGWGEKSVIIVSGIGEVEVPVDYVNINLSINTRNKVLNVAKAENQKNYNAVLESLSKLGIPKDSIKSNFVSINPSYVPCYPTPENPTPTCDQTKIDYYETNRSIGIKLKDLKKYDQVIEKLSQNGTSSVNTGSFEVSDIAKHRDSARELAIASARSKAEKVAAKLAVLVGKPVRFESAEEDNGYQPYAQMARMSNSSYAVGVGGDATDAGTLGTKKIIVTATIAYEIK